MDFGYFAPAELCFVLADIADHEDIVLSALVVSNIGCCANKTHQFRHMMTAGQKIVIEMAYIILKSTDIDDPEDDNYCVYFCIMFVDVTVTPYIKETTVTYEISITVNNPRTLPAIESKLGWLIGMGGREVEQCNISSDGSVLMTLKIGGNMLGDDIDLDRRFPDLTRLICNDKYRSIRCGGTINHKRLRFLELGCPDVYLGNLPNLMSLQIIGRAHWCTARAHLVADKLEVLTFLYSDEYQNIAVSDIPNLRELSFIKSGKTLEICTETLPHLESVHMYGSDYLYTYVPIERQLRNEGFRRAEYHKINNDRDPFDLTPSYFVARTSALGRREFSVSRVIRPPPILI